MYMKEVSAEDGNKGEQGNDWCSVTRLIYYLHSKSPAGIQLHMALEMKSEF